MPAPKTRSSLIPALLVLLVLILAIGGAFIYLFKTDFFRGSSTPIQAKVPAPSARNTEEEFLRSGWQREANRTLRGYMDGTTAAGKLPYIIDGDKASARVSEFYGSGLIDDSDTPAEAFSVFELPMEDRRRGLFMMVYDQPPQFEMREFFRPLASLEVQYGIESAGMLLSSVAQASNFAMEPVRVQAFFKRTPDGLKLDWDVFVQTKYRAVRNFVDVPTPGHKAIFRVFIQEDVPEKGKPISGTRTYMVADPANLADSARINVKIDSEAGRALAPINWRGTKETRPVARTATVELEWVGTDDPQLTLRRLVCWEFLGLGGQDSVPVSSR